MGAHSLQWTKIGLEGSASLSATMRDKELRAAGGAAQVLQLEAARERAQWTRLGWAPSSSSASSNEACRGESKRGSREGGSPGRRSGKGDNAGAKSSFGRRNKNLQVQCRQDKSASNASSVSNITSMIIGTSGSSGCAEPGQGQPLSQMDDNSAMEETTVTRTAAKLTLL